MRLPPQLASIIILSVLNTILDYEIQTQGLTREEAITMMT